MAVAAGRPHRVVEEANELARAVAIFDAGMHAARQQVDPSQQAQRAMALVFVVACERLVRSGLRRQVGRGVADRLDAGLLVIGDDGHVVPECVLSFRRATSR